MNFFSHITISKILYQNVKNSMNLDKKAFIYGNIKPDLTRKLLKMPHTLENYYLVVCKYVNSLMEDDLSIQDYSEKLGEICHYVCDFFCQYHLDETLFYRYKSHFLYELRLHFTLLKNMFCINKEQNARAVKRNIPSIIKDLRKEYDEHPAAMKKDLEYAFMATTSICESIAYFSYSSHKPANKRELEAYYQSPSVTGGQS